MSLKKKKLQAECYDYALYVGFTNHFASCETMKKLFN